MPNETTPIPRYKLYVFYTRYSSWGARVQLLLSYLAIPHQVHYFNYTNPAQLPPADLGTLPGRNLLPILEVTSLENETPLRIADSLSIAEYLHEQESSQRKPLWPSDPYLRALARTATAQMHSGFTALRDGCTSNFIAHFTPITTTTRQPGSFLFDSKATSAEAVARDARDLVELWSQLRELTVHRLASLGKSDEDDGFLCGKFGIVDAFFWPVLWRFRSYGLPLMGITPAGLKWMETMWNDPITRAQGREYFRQARDPQTKMAVYDGIFKGNSAVKCGKFPENWVFDGTIPGSMDKGECKEPSP